MFEKNKQLGLLGSKCFNRIYNLHVLHSAHKQKAVAATFSTENLFLKNSVMSVQHEKSATLGKGNMKRMQHKKAA